MRKSEFLKILSGRISTLSEEDVDKILDYYSEMIDDRTEEGLSEEDAVSAIGNIDEIVSQIFMETPLPKLVKAKVKPNRALKAWEIVLLILGSPIWLPLLLAAGIVLLSVYIVIWAVIIVFYSVVVSFGAVFLGGLLGSALLIITGNTVQGVLLSGIGIMSGGITILLFFGANAAAKVTVILSKKIILWIKACFIGKEKTV